MSEKRVTIFHPIDLLGRKIGGIETFIKNFIKYAPQEFSIEFVGVTGQEGLGKVGEWREVDLYGRRVRFFPVLQVEDENVRTRVPLSLKFTLALFWYRSRIPTEGRILEFHRIETSIPFKRLDNPKVLFVHGHVMDIYNPHSEVKWARFPALYFRLEKHLMCEFGRVYVVREDGAEFYRKKYPALKERFHFLPTWVDVDLFFPYPPDKREKKRRELAQVYGFSPDDDLLLFVGRLEGQKDPFLLVEVFRGLVASRRDVGLIIVGTGSLEGEVKEKFKAYGILDKVVFTGVLPQPELADLLRVCDLFIMTSAFEGMPRSVLEALACGLPVVTTDVGEVRRVVRDGVSGLVCHSRDPEVICKAVRKVLGGGIDRDKCVASIKSYTAKSVLEPVYGFYYQLA